MPQGKSGAPVLPNFDDTQRELIQSQIPLFTDFLQKNNPDVASYHMGTTKWMSATASKLMTNDLFAADKLKGREPAKAEKEIRTFFRNWKNNSYKKSLGITASSESHSDSAALPKPTTRALDDALRGLVILQGDLSARELFLRAKPGEYTRARKLVRSEMPPGTPACAIAQKAMKRAWDEADHEFWEERKRQLEMDVASNRTVWPQYLREAIQQNLDRGIVGSALVGVVYALRTESEGIQHGILYAGYDAAKQEEIRHMAKEHDTILKHFLEHADVHLPNVGEPSIYQFERGEGGFPLLPTLDLNDVSLGRISELLTHYLGLLWDYGYPADNTMPELPWSELAKQPAAHFNTSRYSLMCDVGDWSSLSRRPLDAPALYSALHGYQTAGDPFRFFTKAEYLARAEEAAKRLVDHTEKGDEIVEGDGPESGGHAYDKGLNEMRGTPTPPVPPLVPPPPPTTPPPVRQPTESPHSSPPSTPFIPPPSSPSPSPLAPPSTPPRTPTPLPDPNAKSDTAKTNDKAKASKSKRKPLANGANASDVPKRGSTRNRKTVDFGIQLVAGGLRSPPGRKPAWEYTGSDNENQPPKKRTRRK